MVEFEDAKEECHVWWFLEDGESPAARRRAAVVAFGLELMGAKDVKNYY